MAALLAHRRGAVHAIAAAVLTTAMIAAGLLNQTAVAAQTGYRAHSYAGFDAATTSEGMTGHKPESKLWYHDGTWWAAMLSPAAAGAHTIHRLEGVTWADTGVLVDPRPASREDVLSLGDRLYILSRGSSTIGSSRLRRYTYSGGGYVLDPGFPVDTPGHRGETNTIARDTTGRLWLTFERNGDVHVTHSTVADTVWATPFVLPVAGATTLHGDDIAAVIAFADDSGPAVGIMWSNQNEDAQYFAVHRDGAAVTSWQRETALSGPLEADDHINLKTFEGRVYAATKTSTTTNGAPLIRLLMRTERGVWSAHPVAKYEERNTKPITVLQVDPAAREIYVVMATSNSTRRITYKKSKLAGIGFDTPAIDFIRGPANEPVDFPTTSKQNATADSGIVILASDGSHYWWNRLGGGSAAGPTPSPSPSPSPSSAPSPSPSPAPSPTPSPAPSPTPTPTSTATPGPSPTPSITPTPAPSPSSTPAAEPLLLRGTRHVSAFGTSVVVPRPDGVEPGDVLVAAIAAQGSPKLTPPAGWTLQRADKAGQALIQAIYTRTVASGDQDRDTWKLSAARPVVGGMVAYAGADPLRPVTAATGATNPSSTLISAPSLTVDSDGAILVGFFSTAVPTSVTVPSALTGHWDATAVGAAGAVTAAAGDEPRPVAGVTGVRIAVAGAAARNVGQLIAVRPVADASSGQISVPRRGGSPARLR